MKELNDYRADAEMKLSALEQRKDMEVLVLKQRAHELEQLNRELEASIGAEERRSANLLEKLKDANAVTASAMERQLYDCNEAYKRVEAYSKYRCIFCVNLVKTGRDLESTLHELKSEKAQISKGLEECKSTILHLQDDLDDAQVTLRGHAIVMFNLRSCHLGYDISINGTTGG